MQSRLFVYFCCCDPPVDSLQRLLLSNYVLVYRLPRWPAWTKYCVNPPAITLLVAKQVFNLGEKESWVLSEFFCSISNGLSRNFNKLEVKLLKQEVILLARTGRGFVTIWFYSSSTRSKQTQFHFFKLSNLAPVCSFRSVINKQLHLLRQNITAHSCTIRNQCIQLNVALNLFSTLSLPTQKWIGFLEHQWFLFALRCTNSKKFAGKSSLGFSFPSFEKLKSSLAVLDKKVNGNLKSNFQTGLLVFKYFRALFVST